MTTTTAYPHKVHAEGALRVWWVPQVPMTSFRVDVPDIRCAILILQTLGRYDAFQREQKLKPDYCNAGGLEVLCDGDWEEWTVENTDETIYDILRDPERVAKLLSD